MPDSDKELEDAFREFEQAKKQAAQEELKAVDEILERAVGKKTLLPTFLAQEIAKPDGTLSLGRLLTKGISPTLLAAIIALGSNWYGEYQKLKTSNSEQAQQITALQEELVKSKEFNRNLAKAARGRFRQNENTQNVLHRAVSNLQTEVRVRHGDATYVMTNTTAERPRRPTRREQVEAVTSQTERLLIKARRVQSTNDDDPLSGLSL